MKVCITYKEIIVRQSYHHHNHGVCFLDFVLFFMLHLQVVWLSKMWLFIVLILCLFLGQIKNIRLLEVNNFDSLWIVFLFIKHI